MNYRHAFHAGNHADVLKHAALCITLRHLSAKPKPFFVLDTHAGRGSYDLNSDSALRSGEFRFGAARVLAAARVPDSLAPYRDALKASNPGGTFASCPGSPLIIARALRQSDRLVACELNPGEAEALATALRPWRGARAMEREGYQAIKALLPPPERRGLILIDPPFEKTDEFTALAAGLMTGCKRFAAGVFLAWYPLKDREAADRLHETVVEAGIRDVSVYELYVRAPEAGAGLAGSGLLTINASYALDSPMREALPYLAKLLAQGPGARWRAERLSGE